MKKIYLLTLCFGIAFFALSIPYINKINSIKNDFVEKEKVGKKPSKNQIRKQNNAIVKNKLKAEATKFGVVSTSVSAVQTVAVQGGGNAVPGGQLNYNFILSNTGSDALNVSFTDQLIADLTLVPGSIKSTPIVQNETYQSIGNVGITVPVGNGVLFNDNSPTGEAMAATVTTTTTNGILNLATNGGFTYTPSAGFVGNDSFTYTVTTGTTSSSGTATIQVSGMIWFVNPTAGASGTGTLQSPFKNMSDIVGTAVGNTIFVYEGSPTGATTLLNNQKLVGQGASVPLVGVGGISGITMPNFSNILPSTGGTRPAWSHTSTALTLAAANDIEGINIATSGGTAVTGASVGALKIREIALNNTNGQALQITAGGVLDVIFSSISSANGAKGISVNSSTGSFQVLGTGTTAGSGGTISNKSTRGAEFINCTGISLKNMAFTNANTSDGTISASANTAANAAIHGSQVNGFTLNNIQVSGTISQVGLNLNACTNLTLANSSLANCGTSGVTDEGGIVAMNLSGTSSITNTSVNVSGGRNAYIRNTSTTSLTLTVSGSTFDTANDASNFLFEGNDNSNSTLTIKANTFSNATTHALDVNANGTCIVNVQIGGPNVADKNTVNARTTSPGSDGIFVQGSGAPNVNYNIINNQIQTSFNGYFPINVGGQGTGGQFMGRINNNITSILNAIVPTSGMGIYAGAYGKVKHVTEIKNNTVNNAGNYGIQAESNNNNTASADATMDATIQNNVVNVIAGGSAYAHYGLTANSLNAGSGIIATCANMSGNTSVIPANAALNLELSSNVVGVPASNAVIKIQGNYGVLPGAWTTPNPAGGPTAIDAGGGGTITLSGAFTCLTPTNSTALRLGVEETLAANPSNEKLIEHPISVAEAQKIIDETGINTDFGVNKNLNANSLSNINSISSTSSKVQSGETITVNGSGSGFNLPNGKTTTITFSATIANPTVSCDMTNIATVSGSNFATFNSNSTSVPLVIPPTTSGTISSLTVCSGGTINLTAVCPLGSTTNWYTENGGGAAVLIDNSNYSPTNIITATSYYASCQIGACNSVRTLIGSVSVNALPNATITSPSSVCQSSTLNLSVASAGAGATYLWSGHEVVPANSANTTAVPKISGTLTYGISITDANGCTASSTKSVMINAQPAVTVSADQTICKGSSATLNATCLMNVAALLSGASEVPANASSATGYATGTYNTITKELKLTITFAGLSANALSGHIHGPAAVGVNTGILVGFSGVPAATSGTFTYSGILSGANETSMLNGLTYINIHNATFSGGEIRGQIGATACAADTYVWNPGAIAGQNIMVSPLADQVYTLTASNSGTGCFANATTTVNVTPVTVPAAYGPTVITQNVSTNLFATNCEYLATIVPGLGGVAGNVTVKEWLETTPPFKFVPRHYEIVPATQGTASVTLYFTQKDFDDYNGVAINTVKLPTGPADNAGIANIQLVKYNGVSSPNDGLPESYMGGPTPVSITSIVFDNNIGLWKITFDVTSFSGFLVTTASNPLPVTLISFNGKATEKGNELNWKTSNEKNFSHFEVQRSENAKKFDSIGEVKGINSENYQFVDNQANGINYYRLKMIDHDGKYNYSKTISIENSRDKAIVGNFYPNPTSGKVYIDINAIEKGNWNITTYDIVGKILNTETKILQKGLNKVVLEKLALGVNFVRFETGKISEIRKIIKN